MKSMASYFLIGFTLLTSTSIADSNKTFENVNAVFNVEVLLKSKVTQIAYKNKIIEAKNKVNPAVIAKKVSSGYPVAKQQWETEFKKTFTQKEIDYLNQVLPHELFLRLTKFQQNFKITPENESQIIIELKK